MLSREARAYRESVEEILTLHGITPVHGALRFEAWYYFGRRGADVSNRSKLLLDILQGFAYHNDRQIVQEIAHKRLDHRNPRVELEVTSAVEIEGCPCPKCAKRRA